MNELSVRSLVPTDIEMSVFQLISTQAAESKMYRNIGDKSGLIMMMLAARELGIGPVQALNGGLTIINGKVELSARTMNSMIRRAGHSIKIKENTDTRCILIGTRYDNGDTIEVSFSVEEAKIAGLVKDGGGWKKWPKDMCFARALSRLARQLFADVIGNAYVEGEISGNSATHLEQVTLEEPVKDMQNEVVPFLMIIPKLNPELDALDGMHDYKDIIRMHFGWTEKQVIEELNKDVKTTIEKFESWKIKTQIR